VAQAAAETRPRKPGPPALRGAVHAMGEHPADPRGRLLLGWRTLQCPRGLGQSCCAGLLGVPQMPEHVATDDCRKLHVLRQTAAVLFIRQDIRRQRSL
jgi:hypothetical protein